MSADVQEKSESLTNMTHEQFVHSELGETEMSNDGKRIQDVAAGYDLGVNSYICKPVDFHQFAQAAEHMGLYWLVLNEPPPRVRL